jgi:hypothetical protein
VLTTVEEMHDSALVEELHLIAPEMTMASGTEDSLSVGKDENLTTDPAASNLTSPSNLFANSNYKRIKKLIGRSEDSIQVLEMEQQDILEKKR